MKKESQGNNEGLSASNVSSQLWDFWAPLFLTLCLYLGIRTYVAEARYIPSGSMLPNLKINDRLLIEKITFRYRPPRRGEIVVFNSPHAFDKQLISRRYSSLPSSFQCALVTAPIVNLFPGVVDRACNAYIKRVVAISGDDISVNGKGEVFVNDQLVNELYSVNYCSLEVNSINTCTPINAKVPSNHVVVLGDNRSNSWDSRFWPGGPFLPENQILGRAIWRFWPFNRFGLL